MASLLTAFLAAPAALFAWSLGQLQKPIASHEPPVVHLKNGSYAGVYQPLYRQDYFLGMPYAAPPLGNLRLRVPEPYDERWTGLRNATAYSDECVGYPVGDDAGYPMSEDCLTINVLRPAGTSESDRLPVAFFIFGGGFWEGGSNDKRYNLTWFVEHSIAIGQPIVAVSFNYRLSGWGFLTSAETRAAGATNLGIRDQRLALRWIQENIAAFGGDPRRVTIWGESAGAGSVGIHVTAYGGRDDSLFSGAIGQSGGPLLLGSWTFKNSQALYDNATRAAGCAAASDTLQCLREAPFETLHKIFGSVKPPNQFFPQPDGDLIRGSNHQQLLDGDFVRVPYLIGTNSDEGTVFLPPGGVDTDDDFRRYLRFKNAPDEILPNLELLYPDIPALGVPATVVDRPPSSGPGRQWKRAAAYTGDWHFIAARRLVTSIWAKHSLPAFAYRFNVLPNGHQANWLGVSHFSEHAFVFGNTDGDGYTVNTMAGMPASYPRASALMARMWIAFVNSGDPNGHGVPGVAAWPAYDPLYEGSGYGRNFVFDVNQTDSAGGLGYVEDDTFRGEAIAYLNSIWGASFGL